MIYDLTSFGGETNEDVPSAFETTWKEMQNLH